jgi:aromatic ring-cleaving dioxygenase
MPNTSDAQLAGYHAHVYYDMTTRPTAERLAAAIAAKFPVEIARFSDGPVGPHPIANLLIIFRTPEFETVVPWLMLNRDGLDVLLHPLSDDAVDDHSRYAMWLGTPVPLKLETLPHGPGGQRPGQMPAGREAAGRAA